MGKILPVLLAIIGLGAGIGAGLALRPDVATELTDDACDCACTAPDGAKAAPLPTQAAKEDKSGNDFVKLNNQFVIPVVKGDKIAALVVLSISLGVPSGGSEQIYQREPKLRDAFLQALFDHANAGGFDGAFTEGAAMGALRSALLETARAQLGGHVSDVLITDIARQDL